MTFDRQKIKKIYGLALLIVSINFLIQSLGTWEIIPVFKVFKWLGLARNPFIMILSMLIFCGIGLFFIDRIKSGKVARNGKNQNRANSYGRSLIISIMTFGSALAVVFIVGLIKLINQTDPITLFSYLDFSNNPFFLNIYLFWFFFYSGIIGNLFSSRTVTNPEEEKALLSNIEGWRNSQKSFSKMMSDQKNIAKKFESKDEE